jgi:hypothetical protein
VSGIIFAVFALGHLIRLFTHNRVVIGTHEMPMAASLAALVIAAGLSVWMWTLSARS